MITVLILEDNVDLAEMYELSLTQDGFAPIVVPTLQDAREQLIAHTFDIFMCDMQVGDEYGIDLIKEQRAILIEGHTSTVVVTAQEKYRRACEAAGVEFFMSKPIDLKAFGNLIRRLVKPA